VVTCIVNGYADPCCAVHRRPAAAPAPTGGELPERLDRPAIAGGLARIDARGCGKQSSAHGEVKVSVQVAPSGAVAGVTIMSSPDPVLEACVTAAVRKGAFPATLRGGSFGYAWRF
jgi:TonB family protein